MRLEVESTHYAHLHVQLFHWYLIAIPKTKKSMNFLFLDLYKTYHVNESNGV